MDHKPSIKTSAYAEVLMEGLWSNGIRDNYKIGYNNFIQKKYGRKRRLPRTRFVLWTVIFLFVGTFFTTDDFLR